MRIFATSLLAFFASLFAGGMVAQVLAVASNGSEEWIGVFMLTVLVAIAMTVVFFVAQFRSDQSRAAGSVAKWSLIIFVVLLAIIAAATIGTDGVDQIGKDLPMTAGLTLPGMAIVIVQWLIVRWRAPRAVQVPRFGRGTLPS
jgi:glucan phosphoethanolaminetransferase (alkaline phosphatase superfamily)